MSVQSTLDKIVGLSILGLTAALVTRTVMRQNRRINLSGRTVLITGGSRGLGLALAGEFASQGARIAICARDAGELSTAREQLKAFPVAVHTAVCDLHDPEQIRRMVQEIETTFGEIDVLVNNAGTIMVGPFEAMTADDFYEAMDINFFAALHTTLAVIPRMKARGGGRIVNIGSVGGKMPVPHLAAYCASKFAVVGFSSTLRAELRKDNILVTTANPGLMRTGSPRNALFKGNHKAEYAWFSISDAAPGLSMAAQDAARRIVSAAIHGDGELMIGLPAKLAAMLYGIAPALSSEVSALANRFLPEPGGIHQGAARGRDSESRLTKSPLTHLGRLAERQWNQLPTE